MTKQAGTWVGKLLANRFKVVEKLGAGGMADVYLARMPQSSQLVVIKTPKPEMLGDDDLVARFRREINTLVELAHPHIVQMVGAADHEGVPFAVLAYLAGGSLADRQPRDSSGEFRPVPAGQLSTWLPAVAEALDFIHGRGYLHRDVKPDNILFDESGQAYLADFGITKVLADSRPEQQQTVLTRMGGIIGTPQCMAPEQVLGKPCDGRMDQYALAITVFQQITGRFPFDDPTPTKICVQHVGEKIPAPSDLVSSISQKLSAVVLKALAKKPAQRFPTCTDFSQAVLLATKGGPAETWTPPVWAVANPATTSASAPAQTPVNAPPANIFQMQTIVPQSPPADLVPTRDEILRAGTVIEQPSPGKPSLPRSPARVEGPIRNKPARRREEEKSGMSIGAILGLMVCVFLVLGALAGVGGLIYALKLKKEQSTAENEKKGPAFGSEVVNSIGMKLVRIPPGTFMMGSPTKEQDAAIADQEKIKGKISKELLEAVRSEGPQHEVEITKEFWLGIHEVTQSQFKTVMGYNPSYFSKDGAGKIGEKYPDTSKPAGGKDKAPADTSAFPVENVSWEEAREFCEKLSDLPAEKSAGRTYRLPTEAEWEYSCRGNAPEYQVFHNGNSLSAKQANFNGNHPFGGADKSPWLDRTCQVGSYEKNRFGLFDMHGNVWEWCSDWSAKDYYSRSPRRDPPGPTAGSSRVNRGGDWAQDGQSCRSAFRDGNPPTDRLNNLGFRVALVPRR